MAMPSNLNATDFREATRVLLADGWHDIVGLRWMEPIVKGGKHDAGIASEWVMWWETWAHEKRQVIAGTAAILGFAFAGSYQTPDPGE